MSVRALGFQSGASLQFPSLWYSSSSRDVDSLGFELELSLESLSFESSLKSQEFESTSMILKCLGFDSDRIGVES